MPVLLLVPQEYNRFITIQNGAISLEMTDSGRLYFWGYGLEQGFKSLWFGAGLGSTFAFFEGNESIGELHNEFLRTFLEAGLLGLLPLLCLAGLTVWKTLGNAWRLKSGDTVSPTRAACAVSAILSAVLYFSTMATDNTFYYFQQFGIYVWVLIGLSVRFSIGTKIETETSESVDVVAADFREHYNRDRVQQIMG